MIVRTPARKRGIAHDVGRVLDTQNLDGAVGINFPRHPSEREKREVEFLFPLRSPGGVSANERTAKLVASNKRIPHQESKKKRTDRKVQTRSHVHADARGFPAVLFLGSARSLNGRPKYELVQRL